MDKLREKAIDVIVENLSNYTREQAAEELDASIRHLQELTCLQDYRMSDMRNEVEGLCGFLSTYIVQYISYMIQEENIPQEIKERFCPDEDDEPAGNEFNPYDYEGLIGSEMCQELVETMM